MAFVAFKPEQFMALDDLLTSLKDRLNAVETAIGDGLGEYVSEWLDEHPEATEVKDGSITARKLNVTVTYTVDSNGNLTITLE